MMTKSVMDLVFFILKFEAEGWFLELFVPVEAVKEVKR
jgi:hypothetical protein